MNRALLAVMRAAHTFAIDGNVLSLKRGTHRTHPSYEARLELLRIEQRKNPSECVVRGDAVDKWQVLAQPVELHFAPFDNRGPAFRATNDSADRGQQQFV